MGRVIAICGKGGVGKTTLAALFSRVLLERRDIRSLLIDADPTGGFSMALGLPVRKTINDLRKDIASSVAGRKSGKSDLAASIDYRLLENLSEYINIAFLALGRPEEEGCYCPLNDLLRNSIGYLAEKFDLVLIDAEAGIEQVNRRVIDGVDCLLIVSDLSLKGLHVAETIYAVSKSAFCFDTAGLVLNRVRETDDPDSFLRKSTLSCMGTLPEDEVVRNYDLSGQSFLELTDCPSLQAACRLLQSII